MPIAPGDILQGRGDRYRVSRRVARGGIGEVWRGHALQSYRDVAIKVLSSHRFDLTDAVFERFLREIRHGRTLSHPNLVPTFDADTSSRPEFLVMEFVDGQPLSSLIGQLDADQRRIAAEGIIAGLEHVHERGLVHRDLKTNNVLIEASGTARLCDYGLLKYESGDLFVTDSTDKLGSLLYISSAQLRSPNSAVACDDVYSLLACLFEIYSGQRMSIRWAGVPLMHCSAALQQMIREVLSESRPRHEWPSLNEVRALVTEMRAMSPPPAASVGRPTVLEPVALYNTDLPGPWCPVSSRVALWGVHDDRGTWVHVWDVAASCHIGSLSVSADAEGAGTVAWSGDGSILAASTSRTVSLCTVPEFRYLFQVASIAVYDNIAVNGSGTRLCWGNVFGQVAVVDTETGREFHQAALHPGAASVSLDMSWDPSGETLVVQAGTGALQWWTDSGHLLADLSFLGPRHPEDRLPVTWLPGGSVALVSGGGGLQICGPTGMAMYEAMLIVDRDPPAEGEQPIPAGATVVSHDSILVFAATDRLEVWNAESRLHVETHPIQLSIPQWGGVKRLCGFSPSGEFFVVVGQAEALLWAVQEDRLSGPIARCPVHPTAAGPFGWVRLFSGTITQLFAGALFADGIASRRPSHRWC